MPVGPSGAGCRCAVRARPASFRRWAAAEMRRHDSRLVVEAANALGNYDARSWINEVDVPTAVLVTTEDRAIPPLSRCGSSWRSPTPRAPARRRPHGLRQADLRSPDPRRLPRGGRSGRDPRGRTRASGLTARASTPPHGPRTTCNGVAARHAPRDRPAGRCPGAGDRRVGTGAVLRDGAGRPGSAEVPCASTGWPMP